MKKLAFYIILLSVALLSDACVRDYFERPFFSNNKTEDGELVDYVISFGTPPSTEVTISTKSDLGIVRESNVFNLYLLIFDGNLSTSKKIYGHYFDGDNLIPNNAADPVQAAADAELSNWWQVTNMVAGANGQIATGEGMPTKSSGTLHIKTTQKTGCTIVAIANMNPNDLNVSASLLSTITTFEQLQALVATQIRSEVDANSGYFMMTAQVDGVDFTGGSSNYSNDDSKKLNLQRLYAKVTFNVTIGASSGIEEFIPYNWQLVNVPTCSYLLPRSADYDQQQFFTTDPFNFEKETTAKINKKDISTHSFTFYMMENRKAPNSLGSGMAWSDTNSYTYREKQESGTDPDRAFLYANENATYVILTGKIVMSTTATVGSVTIPNATLDATVTYKIHLGDFTHNGLLRKAASISPRGSYLTPSVEYRKE